MTLDDTWILPVRGAPWLKWGFGTRQSILRNELAQVKQVHGATVMVVERTGVAGEADAMITATKGLLLGIKTADCLPVLMADMNHRVVAAVHAGWRGTASKIVQQTIRRMQEEFGTKPPDVLVALGPAIGKCCFEVGAEVVKEFTNFNPEFAHAMGKCHLDLHAINAWQLEQSGVLRENVLRNELCTVCEEDRFWSYRREKEEAGRMWSVIGIEGEGSETNRNPGQKP